MAQTHTLLQEILRRESRSLLQYLTESFPWTTPEKQVVATQLQMLAAEERDSTARIARYLRRHRVALPYLGSFPEQFTSINFIGLDYALRLLVKSAHQEIAELEQDLPALADAEAQGLIQDILAVKRRHLKDLEELATGIPATTLR